jgi:hypothetical protein
MCFSLKKRKVPSLKFQSREVSNLNPAGFVEGK